MYIYTHTSTILFSHNANHPPRHHNQAHAPWDLTLCGQLWHLVLARVTLTGRCEAARPSTHTLGTQRNGYMLIFIIIL